MFDLVEDRNEQRNLKPLGIVFEKLGISTNRYQLWGM
jgi:hypothetical protein